MQGTWLHKDTLISYTPHNATPTNKILGFDLDHTLIDQKSGKTFPVDGDDWKLLFDNVKSTLQDEFKAGKTIVIFTNQSGIGKGKVTFELLQQRIGGFIAEIGIPIWVYASTCGNHYRKPATAMWSKMIADFKIKPSIAECMYVGDAAGRIKDWNLNCVVAGTKEKGKKKDFSCSDRKFAHNVGITFKTPEEYFQSAPPPAANLWTWDGGLNGAEFLKTYKAPSIGSVKIPKNTKKQEMVFMVGPPASGKSTYCQRYYPNYVRINQDTLKTKVKCLKRAREALDAGDSLVIDNTNPKKKDRKEFLDLIVGAGKGNVQTTALVLDTPKDLALHLNELRVKMTKGAVDNIPMVVYHTYFKYFEEPSNDEGFDHIVHTPFTLTFESDEHKKLFCEIS